MRTDATNGPDSLRKRTIQRDQAIARVSRLTTATAVAGTMATVGFGGLAAVTYSGSLTSGDPTSITSDDGSNNGQQLGQTGITGTTGTTQATPAPNVSNTRSGTPTTVRPPTTTRTRSHVSSGGS